MVVPINDCSGISNKASLCEAKGVVSGDLLPVSCQKDFKIETREILKHDADTSNL
jgi:hypothetical protein